MRTYPGHWNNLQQKMQQFDVWVTRWLAAHSLTLLRLATGIVFLWFGALKLFPGFSPAEPLIRAALWFVPMDFFLPFLGLWEMAIGIGFITGKFPRVTILLMLLQMVGAMSPIALSPDRIFADYPYILSLEGQYVIKDIILIAVGLVIGATVRGGGLSSEISETQANLKI